MTRLSINLNKIALLRNQRDLELPSVTAAAHTVLAAGAHGLTVHPRPDQRHIRFSDVDLLAELLNGYPGIEFNIEGNPFPDFLAILTRVRPSQATLVPDDPGARTSDHGWDIPAHRERLQDVIAALRDQGIRVSLFLDPDPVMVEQAVAVGADRIELYTEPYARAFASPAQDAVLQQYVHTATVARDAGLGINAGHDLNLDNLPPFVAALPWLEEVSIGHAFTADALWMGLEATTGAYLRALR